MNSTEETFRNALTALNERRFLDAERLFNEVLKSNPKHVAALSLLTIVLMSMDRFAEVEEFISRAIALNRATDISFYNYGIILKLHKPNEALEQFDNALRLNAKASETWNNRGTIFNDLQQYERAISDFDQAILLDPGYAEAFCNISEVAGACPFRRSESVGIVAARSRCGKGPGVSG